MMNTNFRYEEGLYRGLLEHTDSFKTEYEGVVRKYKIDKGIPQNYFSFSEDPSENSCITSDNNYLRSYGIAEEESVNARIISIEDNKVIVEMELDNCEIERKLKPFYVRKLKEMNLLFPNSIFQFVYKETQTGQNIEIRPLGDIVDKEIFDFYKMLKTEIGIEC